MKTRKIPLRKCIGCQEMKSKKELLRVVRTPENDVVIDVTGKKSGRGAYLCFDDNCVNIAKKKKSIERALETSISEDIFPKILEEIEKNNAKR